MVEIAGVDPHVQAAVLARREEEVRPRPPHRAQQQRGQAGAEQEHPGTDLPAAQLMHRPDDEHHGTQRGQARGAHGLRPRLVQQHPQQQRRRAILEHPAQQLLLAARTAGQGGVQQPRGEGADGERERPQQGQAHGGDPPVPHRHHQQPHRRRGHQRELARVHQIGRRDGEHEQHGAPPRGAGPQRVHREHRPGEHEQQGLLAERIVRQHHPAGEAHGQRGDRDGLGGGQPHAPREQREGDDRQQREHIAVVHRHLVDELRVVGEPPHGGEEDRPSGVVAAARERQHIDLPGEEAGRLERMDLVPRRAGSLSGASHLPVQVHAQQHRRARRDPPPQLMEPRRSRLRRGEGGLLRRREGQRGCGQG